MSHEPPSSLPPSSVPVWRAAQRARSLLARTLGSVQLLSARVPELEGTIEALAAASNALYEVEKEATTAEGTLLGVRTAAECFGDALHELQALLHRDPEIEATAAHVAEALAVLYPVVRAVQRKRREVIFAEPAANPDDDGDRPSRLPEAPAPPRSRIQTPWGGREQRARGDRTLVEVDIGMWSESNFYTGLSLDLSTGGLFVATYQPLAPSTRVSLYFVLPDGTQVDAAGVVQWTRAGGEDSPPGMGVRFETIGADALEAIGRFCAARAPLYHQAGDAD
jgi:uncharacterized protein (TIGR02266 family)